GDPINYAPHYFVDPLPARSSQPVPVLVVGTVGDPAVPINTAIAMARAAGLVEMTKPDPDFGIPIDQVLIRAGVVEGVAALQPFNMDQFLANLIGRFFETRGRELHFETCQSQLSVSSGGCSWMPDPPP